MKNKILLEDHLVEGTVLQPNEYKEVRVPVKFVFACSELPNFEDLDTLRKIKIIPFNKE